MNKSKRTDETLTPDLSEDRLKRICRLAYFNGWIKPLDLICVVAEDKRWTEELPRLWEEHRKPKQLKFETTAQKFTAWQEIFRCEELRNIPEALQKLEEFTSKKLGLPLPQCLTVDKADEEQAGSVFDSIAPLLEEKETLEKLPHKSSEGYLETNRRLKEIEKELKAILEGGEPEAYEPNVQGKGLLPCKPGTKWSQITMTEVPSETEDDEPMFRVKAPEGEKHYTFHLLGMHHKQKPNQPRQMWALLKLFAQHNGFIDGAQCDSFVKGTKLADHKRLLDKHLQEIFGINESIYEGHAKKLKGHRTKITFRSEVHRSICESTADRRNPEDYKSSSFSPKSKGDWTSFSLRAGTMEEPGRVEDEMIEAIDRKRKTFN